MTIPVTNRFGSNGRTNQKAFHQLVQFVRRQTARLVSPLPCPLPPNILKNNFPGLTPVAEAHREYPQAHALLLTATQGGLPSTIPPGVTTETAWAWILRPPT